MPTTNLTATGHPPAQSRRIHNAIRDLLGLEVDASKFLPSDDSTHGFDNIAGALTMSPALMEAYLSAAGKISRLAIGTATAPTQAVYVAPEDVTPGLPHRRAAVRHARRHAHQARVPGRRRLRLPDRSRSTRATWAAAAPSAQVTGEQLEVTRRRRAGAPVRLGRGTAERRRGARWRQHRVDSRQGGPAHGGHHVPRHQLRAGQRPERQVPAHRRSRRATFRA